MNTHLSPRIPQLNLQVTLDAQRRPVVQQSRARQQAPPKRKRGKPRKLVTRGSVTVKIYGLKKGPFTIAWHDPALATGRQRAMRSDWDRAIEFAGTKATNLANQETWRNAVGQADWASYQRALQILAPTSTPLELAVGAYAESVQKLPAGITLQEAVRFYVEHQPAGVSPKNVPEIITLLLSTKRADKKGDKWLGTLENQLGRFAQKFTGPIHTVQPHEVNAWLRDLKDVRKGKRSGAVVGLKTRANYRAAIHELVRYAQSENYVSKSWDLMRHVDNPQPQPKEARIYTPERLVAYFRHCPDHLVPFLALLNFAGIRHEEMNAPDKDKPLVTWSSINLKAGHIRISQIVGKTKKLRLVKIQPNLAAWLRPYAKSTGPICEISTTGDALTELGKRAGLPWIKNAARKSFISYRLAQTGGNAALVAYEAGNSPQQIRDTYLEVATEEDARAWFSIMPPDTGVLPLFDWGNKRAAAS